MLRIHRLTPESGELDAVRALYRNDLLTRL